MPEDPTSGSVPLEGAPGVSITFKTSTELRLDALEAQVEEMKEQLKILKRSTQPLGGMFGSIVEKTDG